MMTPTNDQHTDDIVVAAICFPWNDDPPYAWNPLHPTTLDESYWRWVWRHLSWGGFNAAALVLGGTETWRQRTRVHVAVLRDEYPSVRVMPQVGKAAFAHLGWNRPVPPDAGLIAETLAAQATDYKGLPLVRYNGRPVWAVLGNIWGAKPDWPPDLLCKVGWEMEREYGHEAPAWFVGHDLVKLGWHHEAEYNAFGPNRRHVTITPPTAALRPGFWHGGEVAAKYVPRLGGNPWREAVKAALDAGCRYLVVEGTEWKEGSSPLPCDTTPDAGVVAMYKEADESFVPDVWGLNRRGSRYYLRALRAELRRHERGST